MSALDSSLLAMADDTPRFKVNKLIPSLLLLAYGVLMLPVPPMNSAFMVER
jgi:hypothetical protein